MLNLPRDGRIRTEDEIERIVERAVDLLDRKFLRGGWTQAEYDAEHAAIATWADLEYRFSKASKG